MLGFSRRETVGAAADWMGISRFALSLRRAASAWITVLTYHRVARRDDPTVLDEGVVDVTPEQLRGQLAFIKKWFDPIGTDELCAFAERKAKLPRNPLMVTFDDGYRDNHDVALPILLEQGMRATFFIATDYVERRRLYWWDRVALAIRETTRPELSIRYPDAETLPLRDGPCRRRALARTQRIIKDRPGLDVPRFVDELEHAAGVPLSADDERRRVDATIMTWEHVAALHRAGMDVQSHTHTHRVLQTLDAPELDRELRVSRSKLEDVLGKRVRAVSYPVGKSVRDAPHIRRAVRDAGYDIGFSNTTGTNTRKTFDPLDIKRISMDIDVRDDFFRAMLAVPWFAY